MPAELIDAHEVLIQEYEILEREFDQLRAAKSREGERHRREIHELRRKLNIALDEINELQALLARSFVRT